MEYAQVPSLSEASRTKTIAIFALGNFITPICTQAYTPILPLYIKVVAGHTVSTIGFVFTIKFFCSFISFGLIPVLVKQFPVKSILLIDYAVRIVSGCFYVAAVQLHHNDRWAMPLLYISRITYGATLHSFGLPTVWCGARIPLETRATIVAGFNAVVGIGITFGPPLASIFAGCFSDELMGYASPGYTTIALSLILMALTLGIDDGGLLPAVAPPSATAADADQTAANERLADRMSRAVCISSFLIMMGALSGFESMLSIMLYDGYDQEQRNQLGTWGVFALLSLTSGVAATVLIQKCNTAQLITAAAIQSCSLSLAGLHWSDLSTTAPQWRLYLTLIGVCTASASYNMHLSIISTRLPPYLSIQVSSMVQAVGQAGRAVGPMFAAMLYDLGSRAIGGMGSGTNVTIIFMSACVGIGLLYPILFHFGEIYGSFSDFSPAMLQKQREKESML